MATNYPFSGEPLIPDALAGLFGNREIANELLRSIDVPESLVWSDLGSDAWRKYPATTVDALAQAVVARLKQLDPRPRDLREKDLPLFPLHSGPEDIDDLSTRPRTLLTRTRRRMRKPFRAITRGDIVLSSGVGPVSLLEILTTSDRIRRSIPLDTIARLTASPDKTYLDQELRSFIASPVSAAIDVSDLRLGSMVERLGASAETAVDIARALLLIDVFPTDVVRERISALEDLVAETVKLLNKSCLREAFDLIQTLTTDEDQNRAVHLSFGIGVNKYSVDEIADALGRTSRWVKHTLRIFKKRVHTSRIWAPRLDAAALVIELGRAADASILAEQLIELGLLDLSIFPAEAYAFETTARDEDDLAWLELLNEELDALNEVDIAKLAIDTEKDVDKDLFRGSNTTLRVLQETQEAKTERLLDGLRGVKGAIAALNRQVDVAITVDGAINR